MTRSGGTMANTVARTAPSSALAVAGMDRGDAVTFAPGSGGRSCGRVGPDVNRAEQRGGAPPRRPWRGAGRMPRADDQCEASPFAAAS